MVHSKYDVIIIGGGAIGVSAAYYIASQGLKIAVLERDEIGESCSFGNMGLISPSHFVPLAAPGMIMKGLKWMFDPESPFYIKPRFDSQLFRWLWQFARSSRSAYATKNMPALRDLTLASLALFKELHAGGLKFGFEQNGLLMLHRSTEGEKGHRHEMELAHELGVDAQMLDHSGIQKIEPAINFAATGGLFFPADGHILPFDLVKSMAAKALEAGVEFFTKTEVLSIHTDNSEIKEIVTTKGNFSAREFVLAAGSWSPKLTSNLNVHIPVQAGRGYSVMLDHAQPLTKTPFILSEARVAITPMGNQIRFGGTLELSGLDLSITQRRVKAILKAVPKYVTNWPLETIDFTQAWAGLRPCTPDGLPFIGRFKNVKNLIAATGHAMLGITLAPITGKLVSEIVTNQKSSLELRPFDPDRF